jgi:hypothetical protein
MPELSELTGQNVMLMLTQWDDLAFLGVTKDVFTAKVTAVNELGIWIENPAWESIPGDDEEEPQVHRIEILLRWDRIRSIVFFPDVEELEDSRVTRIGFRG